MRLCSALCCPYCGSRSNVLPVQRGQADFLPALVVEIFRRQPALEIALARRPFADKHREPGIVAVAALGDHVLAEGAFMDEAITQRRAPRRRIQSIAFPLVAPVA